MNNIDRRDLFASLAFSAILTSSYKEPLMDYQLRSMVLEAIRCAELLDKELAHGRFIPPEPEISIETVPFTPADDSRLSQLLSKMRWMIQVGPKAKRWQTHCVEGTHLFLSGRLTKHITGAEFKAYLINALNTGQLDGLGFGLRRGVNRDRILELWEQTKA